MTQNEKAPVEKPEDPVKLAIKVRTGLSLKRGDMNDLLGQLIDAIHGLRAETEQLKTSRMTAEPPPQATQPSVAPDESPSENTVVQWLDTATQTIAITGPCAAAAINPTAPVAIRSPVNVVDAGAGKIYLGPEVNRVYNRNEALGLARSILKTIEDRS